MVVLMFLRDLLLCALGFALVSSGHQDAAPDRVVRIVAERFSFTPAEVVIDEGSRVEIRVTSEDTTHGFRLIGPGSVNVEVPRRNRGEARFLLPALSAGTYVFECSRVCGAGHGFMRGSIRVRPKEERR
jgi:cytochrome c oxidase subunit II